MNYLLYLISCLGLIIIQTTILPLYPSINAGYDLVLPLIIFLGLFRPSRESIPVILFAGFLMDNLSGGPAGLYMSVYVWLYVGLKFVIQYLQANNRILWPAVIVLGVCVENLCIYFIVSLLNPDYQFAISDMMRTVSTQLLLAMFTGPAFMVFLHTFHAR